MDAKIVWLVWLNNGKEYEDEDVWLIDIRDDGVEKATQIGATALEKYWNEENVPLDKRGCETYSYHGGNAHFWVQERTLNSPIDLYR